MTASPLPLVCAAVLLCVVGKTTTSQLVAEAGGLRYINVGDWVKEQDLHSGFDEEHQAFIIDEDKVGKAAAAGVQPMAIIPWPLGGGELNRQDSKGSVASRACSRAWYCQQLHPVAL